MAAAPQQFCVRWNSYHTNLQAVFPRLLLTEQFADVTLACESRQLRCHKLVLSACSAYLERLLLHNPCDHPIVLMRDMRFSEMQALVDFMYKGEVNVTQEELPSLLKSAEALQIRGLCSGEAAAAEGARADSTKDFTVASDALVAHATGNAGNGPAPAKATPNHATPNGHKKRKSEERPEVKEETVEEDGLYYGELDPEHMEYNEDEEPGKPGSSLGQTSGVRTSTEIVTRHFIDMDHGIPLNIHARPRIVGRRPNAIVNIETDVFQEKSYKQYSSQHLRDALIAVKKGYSVYAASNKYGVPRKTLRNWMEKYDIKSQFSKGRRGTRGAPILDPLDLMQEARSERYDEAL
ncbi:protein bric-a-brac 2-like isoform X11 [Ostrinia furnacalis]|uniref:protein bric-a-brac 2-like isoform X10 n=1 Tax=Ostrinia furnacalis TaxID=93504 RepID=UPI0010386830|nr:protein bric-a-brac 2-like isoform X10 [Ostrinia furnacalis]XP_028160213.1 protein bric-a-brac 2-like isoform X11 [Ostrinia furnacalis]